MGEQRTGRTMRMLIQAIQYAADYPNSAVLVCVGEEHHTRSMRITAVKLAVAMGFEIREGAAWSFRIADSVLYFRPSARSKQHAKKLRDTGRNVMTYHDHRSSGELES